MSHGKRAWPHRCRIARTQELAALREHVEATSPLLDVITNAVPLQTELVADDRGVANA
jgi:hypothetical protein